MRRPPRRRSEPLFGPRHIGLALVQGLGVLAVVLGLYTWALRVGYGEATARGGAFLALVAGNLALALTDSASSGRIFAAHRRIYWLIVMAVALAMTAVFTVPLLAELWQVALPDARLLLVALAAALVGGGWTALLRVLPRDERLTAAAASG